MTTRDEPLDPQEVLEAAEAAHLAARRTVRIPRRDVADPGWDDVDGEGGMDGAAGAGPDPDDRVPDDAGDQDPTTGPDPATDPGDVRYRETVRLPRPRGRAAAHRRAPLPLAATVAALWAALVTFAPVLVVVTLLPAAETGTAALGGPLRVAAAGWLLAHGVPVPTAAGPVGLVPLALAALAAWRVARAGVHVTRARGARGTGSVRQAMWPAVAVAVAYGGIGALVAMVAGGPVAGGSQWGPESVRSGLTLAGFGLLAAGYGALFATGALARLTRRTPVALRAGARAGLVASAGVLAAGAATAGVALAVGGAAAAEVVAAYGTGAAGQAGLTLVCLVYAPNLAVWAGSYLVGPGFAVGSETVVRSSEVVLGPVPAVPVFAALPPGPLPPAAGAALWAVPVLAGAVAGWLLARSATARWAVLVTGAVVAGTVAAAVLGLAAAAAGGPLGGGQLATVGPDPAPVALYTLVTVSVGTLLGAAVAGVARRRQPRDRGFG